MQSRCLDGRVRALVLFSREKEGGGKFSDRTVKGILILKW
jgi:hypothetical protein